ncbi:MAG: hypothetical protein ACRDJV_04820 [Actinomycetota bacterium]
MSPTYLFDPVEPFHPAQHFSADAAYLGVRLDAEVPVGRNRTRRKPVLVYVSSKHELIDAEEDELLNRGLRYEGDAFPIPPKPRWSPENVRAFVEDKPKLLPPGDLYRSIRAEFDKRVEFTDQTAADICTLYAFGTYLHQMFDAFPYLFFTGSKATGKSKTGKLIASLAFNGREAGALTGGALYLAVQGHASTLLLDDREDMTGEDERAIDAMLRNGYKRDGSTMRGDWQNQSAREFSVYSPKIITGIKGLEDRLLSRCIVIEMQPAADKAKRQASEEPGAAVWQTLRDGLYPWALTEFARVRKTYEALQPEAVKLADLSGRSWELWRPLLSLALYFEYQAEAGVDGLTERVANFARSSYERFLESEQDSQEGYMLAYLWTLKKPGDTYIEVRPKDVPNPFEEATGIRISASQVGNLFRRFGWSKHKSRSEASGSRRYTIPVGAVQDAARRRAITLPESEGSSTKPLTRTDPPDTTDPPDDSAGGPVAAQQTLDDPSSNGQAPQGFGGLHTRFCLLAVRQGWHPDMSPEAQKQEATKLVEEFGLVIADEAIDRTLALPSATLDDLWHNARSIQEGVPA